MMLHGTIILVLATVSFAADVESSSPRYNILHIISDDLRPDLPQYNHDEVYAPNLKKLASVGVTFTRAYCQIAVCSPSRMSFLSGRRPESTNGGNALEEGLGGEGLASLQCLIKLCSP
jgi:arylsulfatase A-like enzyme